MIKNIIFALSDLFFPSTCGACGAALPAKAGGLCEECLGEIFFTGDVCVVCGSGDVSGECDFCKTRFLFYEAHRSLAPYRGTMKEALRAFKFNGRKDIVSIMGSRAAAVVRDCRWPVEAVTWVPMARKKIKKRGYNQSKLLAQKTARYLGIPCTKMLRIERGRQGEQKNLSLKERFIVTLGKFSPVRGTKELYKSVLVVDDVFTTGATINECSRILRQQGLFVFSLTIAAAEIKKA